MRALSAEEVLRIWERGQGQPLPERAVMLLTVAFPEMPEEALTDLPLGAYDALLLRVREHLFGPTLAAFVR